MSSQIIQERFDNFVRNLAEASNWDQPLTLNIRLFFLYQLANTVPADLPLNLMFLLIERLLSACDRFDQENAPRAV